MAADAQWEKLDGPLFEAVESGCEWQAKQLLTAGANPNATDGGKMTPLHSAAVYGHIGIFRLLIDNGADITAKTVRGKTALDLAELNGKMDIVGYYADKPHLAPPVEVMSALKFKAR
jgi:ankyrin repeat protein